MPGSDDATASGPSGAPVQEAPGGGDDTTQALRHHLTQVERLLQTGSAATAGFARKPRWQQAGPAEERVTAALAMVLAIGLQILLPDDLAFKPRWILPALEIALFLGLTLANPVRMDRDSSLLRVANLVLIALISLANAWSAVLLVHGLALGHGTTDAIGLLGNGASIYATNILVFGLWYWEIDRGGPMARARGIDPHPDFMFPQMSAPHVGPADWRPAFIDYLYVSFTNATAFSPTDTMPLSRTAKAMMALQSAVALVTIGLIVARAVNVLK